MSNDIHSDGSVDTLIKWLPGGAQGADRPKSYGHFLIAVYKSDEEWHVEYMQTTYAGYSGDWNWHEVEWYTPIDEIDLPFVEKRETK